MTLVQRVNEILRLRREHPTGRTSEFEPVLWSVPSYREAVAVGWHIDRATGAVHLGLRQPALRFVDAQGGRSRSRFWSWRIKVAIITYISC